MIRVAAASLVALVCLAGPAAAAAEKTVSRATASGDYATTLTTANIKSPKIRVRVVTSPSQMASVNWTVQCTKGFSASTKDGSRNARAPYTRTVTHPMLSKASSCIVSATGQLSGSGRITLSILATKR